MTFTKLNPLGIAHYLIPVAVFVLVGVGGGAYLIRSHAATPDTVPVYRLYQKYTYDYTYTTSTTERDSAVSSGYYISEGTVFYACTSASSSSVPIYVLYNKNTTEHYYTTSTSERDSLASQGWVKSGIAFYGCSSTRPDAEPVYRLYYPGLKHFYTTSTTERDKLVKQGWHGEGIVFYGSDSTPPSGYTYLGSLTRTGSDHKPATYSTYGCKVAGSANYDFAFQNTSGTGSVAVGVYQIHGDFFTIPPSSTVFRSYPTNSATNIIEVGDEVPTAKYTYTGITSPCLVPVP